MALRFVMHALRHVFDGRQQQLGRQAGAGDRSRRRDAVLADRQRAVLAALTSDNIRSAYRRRPLPSGGGILPADEPEMIRYLMAFAASLPPAPWRSGIVPPGRLRWTQEGVELVLRRSKTDQTGE